MSKVPAGWSVKMLADITKEKISYGIVQAGPHVNNGIPYIKSSDVGAEISPSSLQRTSEEIHYKYRRSSVYPGDLIFSLRGNIGSLSIVPNQLPLANLTQGTARISVKSDINNKYLRYQMSTVPVLNKINSLSKGSTFKEISLEELRKVEVLIPPLPEQTKIAQILSTWDKAIATTEKLIGNSQQQKKALMQSLLTGKKRLPGFEGEWKMTSLKNIVSVTYGKSPKDIIQEDGMYPVIGTGGVTGWTDKYLSSDKSVILGRKGTIDRPVLIGTPFWAIDTTFYCQSFNGTDITWFYYFVSNINLRIYNEASGVPSISRENLYAIQFKLPPLPEQQKIAAVLTAADNEIELLQKKLAFLKQEKAALMQQLLTGKRRVKINPTEECMDA